MDPITILALVALSAAGCSLFGSTTVDDAGVPTTIGTGCDTEEETKVSYDGGCQLKDNQWQIPTVWNGVCKVKANTFRKLFWHYTKGEAKTFNNEDECKTEWDRVMTPSAAVLNNTPWYKGLLAFLNK